MGSEQHTTWYEAEGGNMYAQGGFQRARGSGSTTACLVEVFIADIERIIGSYVRPKRRGSSRHSINKESQQVVEDAPQRDA